MAGQDSSIADVIRDALHDAQDLVRGEIALAKTEARNLVSRIGIGVALLAGAAVALALGLILLMMTVAWAISSVLGWPVWAGFGIATLLAFILTAALAYLGKKRLTAGLNMPRTFETMKENLEWMRARKS